MTDLRDQYIQQLLEIYDAEKQLVTALPDMVDAASSIRLKQTFTNHLSQTEQHVHRLNEIFMRLDIVPGDETCERMKALIPDSETGLNKLLGDSDERDQALITSAQNIEQFEIEAYEALCTHAESLGEMDALDLLNNTLQEEKNMETTLNSIAADSIHKEEQTG